MLLAAHSIRGLSLSDRQLSQLPVRESNSLSLKS